MSQNENEEFLGFSWSYPELEPTEVERKKQLLSEAVKPLVPSKTHSVLDLVRAMRGMSIQARNLAACYEVFEQMLTDRDRPTVLLGLAGPLIAGGLRQVIREMIELGLGPDDVLPPGAVSGGFSLPAAVNPWPL